MFMVLKKCLPYFNVYGMKKMFSDEEFWKLKGEIGLVPDSKKNGFQWAFLKSFNALKELRLMRRLL